MKDWRVYRSREAHAKHARIRWEAAEYRLSWGVQRFEGPHMRVADGDTYYGVDLNEFFRTHRAVVDREDHYVKAVKIEAYCVVERLRLTTEVNGTLEMVAEVPAGAFVVRNPSGEEYAMSAADFHLRYTLDE